MLTRCGELIAENGEIIVEVPSSTDALLTIYKSEAFQEFTYWSCHLQLFNAHNLALLARQAGLQVNFIRQFQRYHLANHLHWLSRGEPGGHRVWSMLDSTGLNAEYAASLARLGACDTLIASFGPPSTNHG